VAGNGNMSGWTEETHESAP